MFHLLLTKVVLQTVILIQTVPAPSATDRLAMDRFRTSDIEQAREAMAEADWIDEAIFQDEAIPGVSYREMTESPKVLAKINGSFCQISDGAL